MSQTPPPPYGEQPGQPAGQQPGQPPPYQPYQQPTPYGQPMPNAYGKPAYGPPDHSQATTVLVLGILGLVACGLLAPFAWAMGNRVVREIDDSRGAIGGRSSANAGRICGIVGSVLLIFSLVLVVGVFVIGGLAAVSSGSTSP